MGTLKSGGREMIIVWGSIVSKPGQAHYPSNSGALKSRLRWLRAQDLNLRQGI